MPETWMSLWLPGAVRFLKSANAPRAKSGCTNYKGRLQSDKRSSFTDPWSPRRTYGLSVFLEPLLYKAERK
jgi:hypothetical protein